MISVSIVSHNQNALVNRLLHSISEYEDHHQLEILVTENHDDWLAIDVGYSGLTPIIHRNSNPIGFAQNQNRALRSARGDYVCILNPDVVWVEPVFESLINLIANGPFDILAPLIVDTAGEVQDSFRRLPTPVELIKRRLLGITTAHYPFTKGETFSPDWITGTMMFMRTTVFQQLGGFDERYYMYFEDVDFCCRARLAGLRIGVDTNINIIHDAQRESRGINRFLIRHLMSALRFFTSPVFRQIRSFGESK